TYELEYGTDTIEVVKGSVEDGQKVLVVDDLIATGGTMLAACKLVKKLGGDIIETAAIVDLPDIGGSKKLRDAGYKVYAQCEFEGD
ncbi:adenine phosphoribosyltransferase, partial [Candidatus Woesearchaeota archaeon]|nr:adenine phosphoribosyltransferase [Candidatus Woesearchaeota archaeon]